MTNEDKMGGDGKTIEKQLVNPSGSPPIQLPPANTNEHPSMSKTPAEREKARDREIDELKGQMNQLISTMAKLTAGQFQAPPPNPPPQEDPQIAEIEGAPYVIPHFPYMEPDTPKGVTVNAVKIPPVLDANRPPVATLKDYQDIAEDIINRKMRQIVAEQSPMLQEDELQKPYESWHDKVPFPAGWHPPKFCQFDGTGDATEHLVYFELVCGDTVNNPSLLLRQFSASLTGAAFHWYSRIPAGSVSSWVAMKELFRSHFITMRKDISILELSQIHQRRDEKIEDYIIRFRNNYVHLAREMHPEDAIQMCIHGMHQHWLVGVSRRDPKTFSALGDAVAATKLKFEKVPHIMEMYKNAGFNDNVRRFNSSNRPSFNNGGKAKLPVESNTTNTMPVLGLRNEHPRPMGRPNIRELLNKQYVFRRDLVKSLFEQMNEQKLLNLPNPTRPDQVAMTDNPLYCPYHRYVGHKIEDCITFKEWLQRDVDEKKLALKPEALNPNYHTTNMVFVQQKNGSLDRINEEEEYWVPFSQLEQQLERLHLTPVQQDVSSGPWRQVQQKHSTRKRYVYQPLPHSTPTPIRRYHTRQRRMPPRFVPKTKGDESFPRAPCILPTLGEFFPKARLDVSKDEKSAHESMQSSNIAMCNVIA
ncbi:hypothetical protein BS78_10G148100 [Paspalum vaginatum]|nr:hypothetical protein BS78_10G148100 [Paspalum vaginatum]